MTLEIREINASRSLDCNILVWKHCSSLVDGYQHLGKTWCLPSFAMKVEAPPWYYTMSQVRRSECKPSLPWQLEVPFNKPLLGVYNMFLYKFYISGFSENSRHCHQSRIFHVVLMLFGSGKFSVKRHTFSGLVTKYFVWLIFDWYFDFESQPWDYLDGVFCGLNGVYQPDSNFFPCY
jgi:hypothetical protein